MSIAAYRGVCPTCSHDHSNDTFAPTTRETADHAELAACPFCGGKAKSETLGHGKSARTGVKCADVDCPGSMRLVGADEDGVAFWNRRPREVALLSEIAALRGEVETLTTSGIIEVAIRNPSVADYVQHWEGRATQAERQRDELRKALEPFATYPLAVKMDGTVAPDEYQLTGRHDKEGIFRTVTNGDFQRARQALANQGADQ